MRNSNNSVDKDIVMDWKKLLESRKEDLKVAMKRAYINACLFEEGDEIHYIGLWYTGDITYFIRAHDPYMYLLGEGLLFIVYEVRQFDCTSIPEFNYMGYMTGAEIACFYKWCKTMGYTPDWSHVKSWSGEIYDRIGAEHRKSMIASFDPEAVIEECMECAHENDPMPIGSRIYENSPMKFPIKPITIPEFALRYYLDFFDKIHDRERIDIPFGDYDANKAANDRVPLTYLGYMLTIMNSFEEEVRSDFCEEVFFALSRYRCWDKPTRLKVLLEGCTYKELVKILHCDLMDMEYKVRRYQTKSLEPYQDEKHILFDESLGPLGIENMGERSLVNYGWTPV